MYDARRATGWVSVFYFVSLIIMGMMIVMNLFLAILLSNFTNKEDVDAEAGNSDGSDAKPQLPRGESVANPRAPTYNPASPPGSPTSKSPTPKSPTPKSPTPTSPIPKATTPNPPTPNITPKSPAPKSPAPTPTKPRLGTANTTKPLNSARSVIHPEGGTMEEGTGAKVVPTANNSGGGGADFDGKVVSAERGGQGPASRACRACKRLGVHLLEICASAIYGLRVPTDLDPGKALFLLGPNNKMRMACAAVVANPGFDRFILLLISVSSLALAMDSPLRDPDSDVAGYLERVEGVMNVLFFIEMTLKISAHGFVLMHGAYLRSAWNVLDFVVVVISMVQLFTGDSGNLESLRSLRTLRALRPLR